MYRLVALSLFFLFANSAFAIWPDYRGPNGDGVSDATGLPVTWSETKNVAWKTPIHGRAWSSPVLSEKRVWLTTATPDGKELYAVTIDRESGKIVRDLKLYDVAEPQFAHAFNTHASPSPLIDGDRVYIEFGSYGTACLREATGEILWSRRDINCNHFRGAGSSAIIWKDLLILSRDGSDAQYLTAVNKMTGETVWKTDRTTDFKDLDKNGKPARDGDMRKCFSTPIVYQHDGEDRLFSPGAKAGFAYDLRSGKELWTITYVSHSSSSRTIFGHGMLYVNTGFGKPDLLAVRPGGSGDVTKTHIAWKMTRGASKKPAPLLVGDDLVMVEDKGVVSRVNAKTGKLLWQERIGGNHSASPVLVDGRIYFFSEDGKTAVISAGSTFEKLAENKLPDGFMSSPAIGGKAFYLRTKAALYRIEKK
jgi:outer membrane protein assembly factor BamB